MQIYSNHNQLKKQLKKMSKTNRKIYLKNIREDAIDTEEAFLKKLKRGQKDFHCALDGSDPIPGHSVGLGSLPNLSRTEGDYD